MTRSFRRLTTGVNADGKSTLVDEAEIAEGELGNFNLWMTRPEGKDGAADMPFFPPPGATTFRVVRLPPPDPAMTPEDLAKLTAEFFAGVGSPACRRDTSRHPFMHVTPTTDYIMLLEGEISLLLDTGEPIPLRPFDAVVQRATNHAWLVTGDKPAIFLAVMTGAASAS
ncbi:cupin domain-containing protein [Methylocapsa sp. S129]|uniref:cupin domain-containing protein n=1 Tax=Methylocapsa sp. S129 TaxID=1641869 RepID=UPI00131C93AF|nr:cupin domain-containing protein [Methylocapsa sp. S129]